MKVDFVATADFVNRANSRMIECRGQAGLTLKAGESERIFDDFIRQKLQGDLTVQSGVLGLVDDAHVAASQLAEHAVMRDGFGDHGGVSDLKSLPNCLI